MRFYVFISLFLVFVALNPLSGCLQEEKTCLVLSVGGANGLAHAGAIDALTELGIDINCVYGNSMGAVVGSLYAHNPKESPKASVKQVFNQYRASTEKEMGDQAVGGFLAGAALVLLSGGTLGWETMLATTALGAFSVEKFDNRRFMGVLDRHFNFARMDTLPIPFATSYQSKANDSLEFVVTSSGNLAQAVARSANNPFVFSGTSMQHLDPGSDRIAMTPIEDAFVHFTPSKIIAINVTGVEAHYSSLDNCNVTEIMVEIPDGMRINSDNLGAMTNELYEYGYLAVMEQLGR